MLESITTIPSPATGVAWLDAVTILLVAAMTSLTSFFAIRAHRTASEIRNQVVNGHADAPPMRADLDRVIAAIEAMARDITGLRKDLADEEARRVAHLAELREEVHRRLDDVHRRIGH